MRRNVVGNSMGFYVEVAYAEDDGTPLEVLKLRMGHDGEWKPLHKDSASVLAEYLLRAVNYTPDAPSEVGHGPRLPRIRPVPDAG